MEQEVVVGGKSPDFNSIIRAMPWAVASLLGFVLFVLLAYFFMFGHYPFSTDQQVWGVFGDFVGGTLNPILSFAAFVALVLTLRIQLHQSELASGEIQAARSDRNDALEHQKQTTAIQIQIAADLAAHAKFAMVATRLAALHAALNIVSEDLRQRQAYAGHPGLNQEFLNATVELVNEKVRITEEILAVVQELRLNQAIR